MTNKVVLPPVQDKVSEPIPMPVAKTEPVEAEPKPMEEAIILPPTNSVTNIISTSTAPEPVSAQMLLKYLRKSGQGTATGVVIPMDFTPPRAAPESKATYSTTP